MPDGKALQAGTSHELGQNFSRAYEIKFSAEDQTEQLRLDDLVGDVVAHARRDDHGAWRRPRLAHPAQDGAGRGGDRADRARRRQRRCSRPRAGCWQPAKRPVCGCKLDDREGQSPGFKFNEWDMRGVPLRIELGARDLEAGVATARPARPRVQRRRPEANDRRSTRRRRRSRRCSTRSKPTLFAQAEAFLDRAHDRGARARGVPASCSTERAGMIEIPWCERPAVRSRGQGSDQRDDARSCAGRPRGDAASRAASRRRLKPILRKAISARGAAAFALAGAAVASADAQPTRGPVARRRAATARSRCAVAHALLARPLPLQLTHVRCESLRRRSASAG